MYEYPVEVREELVFFLPLLRGKLPDDIPLACRAGWAIQGYAQAQLISDGPQVEALKAMEGREVKGPALADILEDYLAPPDQESRGLGSVPWGSLFDLVKILVDAWMKSR